jgi:hypothetical protein
MNNSSNSSKSTNVLAKKAVYEFLSLRPSAKRILDVFNQVDPFCNSMGKEKYNESVDPDRYLNCVRRFVQCWNPDLRVKVSSALSGVACGDDIEKIISLLSN